LIEEFATEKLLETRIRPQTLVQSALLLSTAGAIAFFQGWLWTGLALLLVTTPLGLIARRLAALRLKPMHARSLSRRLLWPAAGVALIALGWWQAGHGSGWGALFASATAAPFRKPHGSSAGSSIFRVEFGCFPGETPSSPHFPSPLLAPGPHIWCFWRYTPGRVFSFAQHVNHGIGSELT
jgi:hypothetical protein